MWSEDDITYGPALAEGAPAAGVVDLDVYEAHRALAGTDVLVVLQSGVKFGLYAKVSLKVGAGAGAGSNCSVKGMRMR